MPAQPAREAVAVFRDFASLQAATDALLTAGFDRAALSLLADSRTIRRKLGRACTDVRLFEDLPEAPFRPFAGIDSRIEAEWALVGVAAYAGAMVAAVISAANGVSVGVLIAWVAAAALGSAAIAAVFAGRIESGYRRYLREMMQAGGLLLWVRAQDEAQELRALEILRRFGASDVHAHTLPAPGPSLAGHNRPALGVSRELAWLDKPFFRALMHR